MLISTSFTDAGKICYLLFNLHEFLSCNFVFQVYKRTVAIWLQKFNLLLNFEYTNQKRITNTLELCYLGLKELSDQLLKSVTYEEYCKFFLYRIINFSSSKFRVSFFFLFFPTMTDKLPYGKISSTFLMDISIPVLKSLGSLWGQFDRYENYQYQ